MTAPVHKISYNEMADIEQYLSKEKGIDTIDELIAYLQQIDPNNIDPKLIKLGLKSEADMDHMIQAEEQAKESLRSFSKIIEDNPVFNPMRSDSVFNIIRHDPNLKALGQTVATMQSSFGGSQMADLAQTVATMQSSFGGSQMADLAQTVATMQSSFGGFEQLSSKLQEVAWIAGPAFDDVLDALRKATDQTNYSTIEKNSAFAAEESYIPHHPPKAEASYVTSAEAEWKELQTEISNFLNALFTGIDSEGALQVGTLAMMTLGILKQTSSVSEPSSIEAILAIIIIWGIVLVYLEKKGRSIRSADEP
jgi:hypothetical protein